MKQKQDAVNKKKSEGKKKSLQKLNKLVEIKMSREGLEVGGISLKKVETKHR